MKKIEGYVEGTAKVSAYFPIIKGEPQICCSNCVYYSYATHRCRLQNGEFVINSCPDTTIGYECPLKFKEVNGEIQRFNG